MPEGSPAGTRRNGDAPVPGKVFSVTAWGTRRNDGVVAVTATSPVRAKARARANDEGTRDETPDERYDRNLLELLQELRVAGIGVQVLFGFLLSLPFTGRFDALNDPQRWLYVVTLLLAALAVAFLVAPVAYHRVVFRRHQKDEVVQFAQWTALWGLVTATLAIGGALALALTVVVDGALVAALAGGVAATFGVLWFVVPALARRERR